MQGLISFLTRLPGLRRLAGSPRLQLQLAMIKGSLATTDPLRFTLNEILLRRGVRSYRLTRTGQRMVVRHPMSDAWVLNEVVRRQTYDPPAQVLAVLPGPRELLRFIDLGGHVGSTTLFMLDRFPEAEATTFEPNPANAALLRRNISLNELDGRCRVIEAAAGVSNGSAQIRGFSVLAGLVTRGTADPVESMPFLRKIHPGPDTPTTVEVREIWSDLSAVDLLKIDIEGGEWAILRDPRFADTTAKAVVLEYHPAGAPEEDARHAATNALRTAGFVVGEPFDEHAGEGTVWAWRSPTA